MASSFPTLNSGIIVKVEEATDDISDLVSTTEAGYQVTRRRFTRDPKTFKVSYKYLDDSDHDSVDAHITDVATVDTFTWTHPRTGVTHTVRFKSRPSLTISGIYWDFQCEMREV